MYLLFAGLYDSRVILNDLSEPLACECPADSDVITPVPWIGDE